MGILEDADGRLWISSKKGISRFDPQSEKFKNYDVSDGLRSNDFTRSCHQRGRTGEMFFCGNGGVTAFFPEDIRENPFVPPVVLTSFKISDESVPIGAGSVLKKAIPYADSLTLSYWENFISFKFAALSYANPHKNRYRYRLEGFAPDWNEVDSTPAVGDVHEPGSRKYVFRVQGSNSDGVWNEAGVSLPIVITPPWYKTNCFAPSPRRLVLALMWVAYQRPDASGTARVRDDGRRSSRRADAHRPRAARYLAAEFPRSAAAIPDRVVPAARAPGRGERETGRAIEQAAKAITEGRDAVQGLRASTVERNDLPVAIRTLGRRARDRRERRPASGIPRRRRRTAAGPAPDPS